MAQKTVLDFPLVTDPQRTDVLYTIRGVGADRDKHSEVVPILNNLIYSVATQDEFNAIIERESANTYKIKDGIRALLLKYLLDEYLMHGGTSPLSDGDTWGYLYTNQTSILIAEADTPINFGATQGWLLVNTPYIYMNGIHVKGDATTGVGQSLRGFEILTTALRARLYNCKVSDRKLAGISKNFIGFTGSNTGNDESVYLENCLVEDITDGGNNDVTDSYGFRYLNNMVNCVAKNITFDIGLNHRLVGFRDCDNLTNCVALNLETSSSDNVEGFRDCNLLNGCIAKDLDSVNGNIIGFYNSREFCNCRAYNLGVNSKRTEAFLLCTNLNSCWAVDLFANADFVYGFKDCQTLAGCIAQGLVGNGITVITRGFDDCKVLTGCQSKIITADDWTAVGFESCNVLSACEADQIDYTGVGGFNAIGFSACNYLSACWANNIDAAGTVPAAGFTNCQYGSSLFSTEPVNPGNDWMDVLQTEGQITNKASCPSMFT